MGIAMTAGAPESRLPELGPMLGRAVLPPEEKTPLDAALEGVRFELLTLLFERADSARRLFASGDESGARAALGGATWLPLWERAVDSATRILREAIERQVRDAAAVSRYPTQRLAAVLPDAEEERVLAARLSAAGIGLEEAVERLDAGSQLWNEGLRRVTGELEAAWERLLATAHAEVRHWSHRAAEIHAWRRPWWPLVLFGAVVLSLACWLGLVLGGYLPVPGWLRPFTSWVWNL
ncbi:MAG TPA: hypothetical protein VGQ69_02480 [Gemmatimonadales bacterium]|jgi:hypothetical protein|nr:hypothetical protein [Gemmatimonadales bacterium]